jgi:hypothetical protein
VDSTKEVPQFMCGLSLGERRGVSPPVKPKGVPMRARWITRIAVLSASALGLVLGGGGSARADVLYGTTAAGGIDSELLILNPATGAVLTDVGPVVDVQGRHYGVSALAFEPGTGVLYGATTPLSATAPRSLVTVDPATARATLIGPFGAGMNSMTLAFDPTSGALYGAGTHAPDLYRINRATGGAALVGPSGFSDTIGGALVADAAGTLYGAPTGSSDPLRIYDKTTGGTTAGATLHGAPLPDGAIKAMTFDSDGVLFGTNTNRVPASATVYLVTIDPVTGQVSSIGRSVDNLSAIAFQSVQEAAVPEPSSLALFGLGALGLVAYRLLPSRPDRLAR